MNHKVREPRRNQRRWSRRNPGASFAARRQQRFRMPGGHRPQHRGDASRCQPTRPARRRHGHGRIVHNADETGKTIMGLESCVLEARDGRLRSDLRLATSEPF